MYMSLCDRSMSRDYLPESNRLRKFGWGNAGGWHDSRSISSRRNRSSSWLALMNAAEQPFTMPHCELRQNQRSLESGVFQKAIAAHLCAHLTSTKWDAN